MSPAAATVAVKQHSSAPCRMLFDSSNCSTVLNLSCKHQFRHAFFHRIVDCLTREYWTLKTTLQEQASHQDLCIVGFGNRAELYHSLKVIPEQTLILASERIMTDACIQKQHPGKKVVSLNHNDRSAAVLGADAILKDLRLSRGGLSEDGDTTSVGNILLVVREGTRNWEKSTLLKLMKRLHKLARRFHTHLVVHDGSENVTATMGAYYQASVILMYHGAAAANLLFTRRNTVVVEITTYKNTDSLQRWRSNKASLSSGWEGLLHLRPDLRWFVHHIPLSIAYPQVKETEFGSHSDGNRFIKGLRNVHLSRNDIDNIEDLLAENLRHALVDRSTTNN